MPSTYSSLLRLELIAVGEQDGTWGSTTNTNLGTLIEQAITGMATITHSDAANYTLSANNGSSDEARCAILKIGGALTANRNVVVPTSVKSYLVHNNTTGGFSLVVKTSGGSGVTVTNGTRKLVYCDGTDVVDAIPVAGDIELAAIAGLTSAADRLPYFTGSGTAALATFTAAGRALVDDADAATQRATIGIVTGSTDNAILRADGTGGATLQGSSVTIDDAGVITQSSSTASTNFVLTNTDGGTAGVGIIATHASASPANNDSIFIISARGKDSGGNTEVYGQYNCRIVDTTNGSEDGIWDFQTTIAGTFANRFHIGAGVFTSGAAGGDQGADSVNAGSFFDDGVQVTPRTLGTAQASTSGTSIDFTSIPSWAKEIKIMFSGVSTSGTNNWLIQIGDSGGIETSGYLGASSLGGAFTNHTDGFGLRFNTSGTTVHGVVTLSLMNAAAFTWASSGNVGRSDSADLCATAGVKSTSAALDRVRITTVGGTDTFDAGSINIQYS